MNKMFAHYAKSYYSNTAISSVYVWELDEKLEDGFCCCVLIKNNVGHTKSVESGNWDSTNFVNVKFENTTDNNGNPKLKAIYKLTTTVILKMNFQHVVCGHVDLSGTVTRFVFLNSNLRLKSRISFLSI